MIGSHLTDSYISLMLMSPFRMANLSYIKNFCFSHSTKDELSYCLSTFEAAVEYIKLGKLQDSHSVRATTQYIYIQMHCL